MAMRWLWHPFLFFFEGYLASLFCYILLELFLLVNGL